MKAAVIVFPGSNCDRDIAVALEQSSGNPVTMVWHRDSALPKVDLVVIPGGFAYGDYLRCGAMAAHSPIMREVVRAAGKGQPVLGICNGFQVLTEAGLLPGVLMRNASLKYLCKDVNLKVETSQSLFTSGWTTGQVVRIPIGHGDGNYFADNDTLNRMEDRGQVALRYCSEQGAIDAGGNPNGSARNIAGVFNDSKTVLGMMPHPERLSDPALGGTDGKDMFDGIARALT
ncbi:MAG: phosphoribosylformylglycinamidine synthase subunit PurQ [Alphaproteobacteria bacterium]|nr:phosphoribosylformylglycinamidine synthase subunit PurQ [Alphaproteobacteria bacterium]